MGREQQKEDLKDKIKALQEELSKIENEREAYVVIISAEDDCWYCVGEVYKLQVDVVKEAMYSSSKYVPLVSCDAVGVSVGDFVIIEDGVAIEALEQTSIKDRG